MFFKLKSISKSSFSSGIHEISIDARHLSSGTYLIRLEALNNKEHVTDERQITLIK